MLSAEDNARLTGTSTGTPAGDLLRRYWQPAALLEELDGERPVVPVRLLGEDLVLFRGDDGMLGLIGRQCPHRGVDLCYGRLEDGGLRCPFHGWLFDSGGKCLEQPAEPEGSNFHTKIAHTAYPVAVRNGIVFAYLGPGAPPAFADFDCFTAPDAYSFAFKGMIEANWLQALEVGIDPAHASFLHRFFEDEEPEEGYGKQFGDATADIPVTRLLRDFPRPEIRVEEMDYGMRIMALRDLGNRGRHVRVTNLAFPNAIVIPMSAEMTISQWHVPIDDTRCYWYAIFTAFENKVDKDRMRAQRLKLYRPPDYRAVRNRENHWGFDPAEQNTGTFTGMGMDINVHDNWAVESPGPIFDRTGEHLGATDKAIIANRRLLAGAIDAVGRGDPAPMMPATMQGPLAVDTLCPPEGWESAWRAWERDRRRRSPWAT
ncbi:MAG: aromatic ring-hydroxylating dioxygenase subunit alpha [Alphaproteobacteria bacterium]